MILTQYYLNCLSHGSYLVGDETTGQAIVVDPRRDIDEYLADAKTHDLNIVGVINTHFHADFVAGHLELAEATGAWIGYGERAEAEYPIRHLADGEKVSLGEVEIEILETPGHTWESISLLVREHAGDEVPHAVLTGDALFIGDVGRPDLAVAVGGSTDELARALYSSVHRVLMPLPDSVRLFPAHGAGSACGKNISDDTESTIGDQRSMNPSVQPMSEDDFVKRITTGQPAIPEYFAIDAVINRQLHQTMGADRALEAFTAADVREAIGRGVQVLDTRSAEDFANAHLTGSINVGIDGRFAETAGMVMAFDTEIVIVADQGRQTEAGLRLGRIGFDKVIGYLARPADAFVELTGVVQSMSRTSVEQLDDAIRDGATVLDVRNAGELDEGTIPGSLHIALAELVQRHDEIPAGRPVVVQCASGWRSSVGASALRSLGHENVSDLLGGYGAWKDAGVSA